MNKLQADETVVSGKWLVKEGRVRGDANCERIKWLIAQELTKILDSPDSGGWETLYRDLGDGRYWERTYPQGELHGGGPPELRMLTAEEAGSKYRIGLM